MKTVVHGAKAKDKTLHIEAEGCVVNIRIGLHDTEGHEITSISVLPDKYMGESWSLPDYDTNQQSGINIRVRKDQK